MFSVPHLMQFVSDLKRGLHHPQHRFLPESVFVFIFIGAQKPKLRGWRIVCKAAAVFSIIYGWSYWFLVGDALWFVMTYASICKLVGM